MRKMRLTSFTDYSLRVLMYLATDPDRRARFQRAMPGWLPKA